MTIWSTALPLLFMLSLVGCGSNPRTASTSVYVAAMGGDDAEGFASLRDAFGSRNPGYDIRYERHATGLAAAKGQRVVFVQEPSAGQRVVPARVGETLSPIGGGDIVLLRPDVGLHLAEPLDLLVYDVPVPLPADLPAFIRPDWDDRITDTPGGCATETGAYRRILLTWLDTKGPYIYHALNAHRVRITDSFTHYHPVEGGFDEFYFVQMTQPGARLIVSRHTGAIEQRDAVSDDDAVDLLESHDLAVGDVVYIPRGIVHRGVGGALVQVITIPGFKPGAEIGVDHHLRAIAERLDVDLPYNVEASSGPVIR